MAPQSRPPTILLTRPAAQSARFAAALRLRFAGIRILCSALIAPRHLSPTLADRKWTALILTSETAVLAARRIIADGATLPRLGFCVGTRTAEAARAAGFEPLSAQGDADALVDLILSHNPSGPLLHLQGRHSRGDIAKKLISAGIETYEAIAYAQESQSLTPEATAFLTSAAPVIAPLFSPRTAQILVAECARINRTAPLTIVALSSAVAIAAAPLAAQTTCAARPDAEAMVDAIATLLAARR